MDFAKWWLYKAPKHIFIVSRRFLYLFDTATSFTLNLKLVFTPLFGSYSLAGRLISFVIRLGEIFFGFVVMLTFSVVTVILPMAWWLTPVAIFKFAGVAYVVLYALAIFCYQKLIALDTPKVSIAELKATNLTYEDYKKVLRPECLKILAEVENNWSAAINTLSLQPSIALLLVKSELNKLDFVSKLGNTPPQAKQTIVKAAFDLAVSQQSRFIELEQVFTAIVSGVPKVDVLLSTYGTNIASLKSCCDWLVSIKEEKYKRYIWQEAYEQPFAGGIGRGMTGRVTPQLDAISTDFTKEVIHGRIRNIIGRDTEIKKIAELLSSSKQNILIIGAPGSGKTSIVKGISYRIITGTEYKSLQNKRIVNLEIGALIAGAKTAGEVSAKLTAVLDEVKASGDIILFIDEIQNLVAGTGDNNPETSTIYSILEPELLANKIQFIGATTIQNYRKFIEPNGAFSRIFQIVEIEPASKADTTAILKHESRYIEVQHKLLITYPAIEKTVELSEKLMHERVFPDKAIDIMERAASSVEATPRIVDSVCVEQEIADMTHVPVEAVSEDEAQKLLNIEAEMHKMVIGQDEAIKQIGAALKRARIGIRDETKPIASFLFFGTTGVGKTQTAKALAKCYFGNAKNMIRLDMSEYQQLDSIDKLIGTPDGKTKGNLTEAVRTKPFALILLDEIEKAHPNLLLTFLQVLDDGRLTDSAGNVVDFTNTIIIATSNTGTRSIQEVFQRDGTTNEMRDAALKDVRSGFAPEFLNRFTGIIVFNPLTATDLHSITNLLLADVARMAQEKGIKISFSPELVTELISRGFNPEWGARPLARVVEDSVESYLAVKMLSGQVTQGDELTLGTEVFSNV
jgi:ATP-dependent Clp protease ATP-binding subunit ClpC